MIHIRELRWEDVDAIGHLLLDQRVTKYLLTRFNRYSAARQYVTSNLLTNVYRKDPPSYVICDEHICIGYLDAYDYEDERVRITYVLHPSYWGKNMMSEVVQNYTDILYQKYRIHRVEALCFVEHAASRSLLKKAGFIEEGILREYTFVDEHYQDVVIYSKLKEER